MHMETTTMKCLVTPLEPEDLELLYTIENNPDIWHVSGTTSPYSRYALRDYIANQQADIYADKQIRLVIRATQDGASPRAVGLVDLFDYSPQHQRAEMGLAILAQEQGKGYATQAVEWIKTYARQTLHLQQVYAIVSQKNAGTVNMLQRCGFVQGATLKRWVRHTDGTLVDALLMQLFLN